MENENKKPQSKTKKEVPQRTIAVTIPESIADDVIKTYAALTRGRVRQAMLQLGKSVDEVELKGENDLEVVVAALRQQILGSYERQVQQDALNKLRENY